MKSFDFNTAEDFKNTPFGRYLLEIVELLALPTPSIKGGQLKKFNKEGCWGVRLLQPGRETEPKNEDIKIKLICDSKEKGLNIVIQELIGRLCGQHHRELKNYYSHFLGRRDENGNPYILDKETKHKFNPLHQYLQDLENHLKDLEDDRRSELLKNDELRAQLKETEKKIKAQEEVTNAQEEKFKAQDRKFQNQEKRTRAKNKEIKDLKMNLKNSRER